LVKQYKGNSFLYNPDIWNSYFTIIDYILNVHDIFLILQIRFFNELFRIPEKILKEPDNFTEIKLFRSLWEMYIESYNDNIEKLNNKFFLKEDLIIKAFNKIQEIEDRGIMENMIELNNKFYKKIKENIINYNDGHVDISKHLDGDFIKTVRSQDTTVQLMGLIGFASALIMDTDKLLRKLIDLIH
jgi:hypothetical protein